ncbi:MAG: nucleoside 2-deoxyribosyltransferase [Ktedonobacteraceae bacterium]
MIYLCSNLFSRADQEFNIHIAQMLRTRGWEIFVPQEQPFNEKTRTDIEISSRTIFSNDTAAIIKSNAIFAVLDGPDIGSGIAFELGMFWTLHKQFPARYWGCVGLWTDIRQDSPDSSVPHRSQKPYINQFCIGGIEDMGVVCRTLENAVEEMDRILMLKEGYASSLGTRVSLPKDVAFGNWPTG